MIFSFHFRLPITEHQPEPDLLDCAGGTEYNNGRLVQKSFELRIFSLNTSESDQSTANHLPVLITSFSVILVTPFISKFITMQFIHNRHISLTRNRAFPIMGKMAQIHLMKYLQRGIRKRLRRQQRNGLGK